jgi:Cu(I)/Ag(I) efflux system protein CusF
MNALSKLAVAAVFTFSAAAMAVAQEPRAHGALAPHAASAAHAVNQTALADGEIKKVDRETGKLTIRHSELKNLGMQAMTMAFRTKDAAMLDQVAVGDKVKFVAERLNGAFTVVLLENAK